MQDVKWIKLYTDFPNNRKIKQLMKLPNGPSCVCVWVFLMCLAGDINENGSLYFTDELPYTDEMLADQFDLPVKTVRQALNLFEKFGMIEIIDDVLQLRNWEKYQAADRLEKIKEQDKIRARAYRERKRIAAKSEHNHVTHHVTRHGDITANHATDIRDKNIEKDSPLRERDTHAHTREGIGVYKNVFLSDNELEELMNAYPDTWAQMVNNLSSYMKSTGTEYASHYATIMRWADQDAQRAAKPEGEYSAYNYDDLKKWAEKED